MVTTDRAPAITPQVVVGLALVLAGIIFTLDNLGLADAGLLLRFWPVILILIGVLQVMHAREAREWLFACLWLGVGGTLLAKNLGYIGVGLRDLLPLLLVFVGLRVVLGRDSRDRRADRTKGSEAAAPPPAGPFGDPFADSGSADPWHARFQRPVDPVPGLADTTLPPPPPPIPGSRQPGSRPQIFAMFSGVERRVRTPFVGAEVSAIMGGCELDLRQATAASGVMHISAFALWGGIEIRVPETWSVLNESMALLGGVEDTTRDVAPPGSPRLIIRGMALMGGIEIKN